MYKGEKRTMYNAWQTACMQHPFGTQERQPSIRERKSKHIIFIQVVDLEICPEILLLLELN